MRKSQKCPSFEESIDLIDNELNKRRGKWTLSALSYIDYDDVAQIIRLHIWKKWDMWDCSKPLIPWISVIISHQISNLIRNHYSNYSKPCSKCEAAEGNDGCKIYGQQCADCPWYAEWTKKKAYAQQIKMPVALENHAHEIAEMPVESDDILANMELVHVKAKEILKPSEYLIYEGLFILHESEEQVAKKAGYISNEKGRRAGYRQIINVKNIIIEKIKKAFKEEKDPL
jgi:hypothetical protein